ncbi:response regulator transcription factor [Pseudomonas sp. YQ_5]|uniref:response regulator transcription factor n=1 Tax=Pseudomonas sp. YQ_5 TaxID=3367229 RepID=UPI00370BF6D1
MIEDDKRTSIYLRRGLTEAGHVVDTIHDGRTGLAMALEGIYHALVIDRSLPGMDGLEVVRALRSKDQSVPILMLSAKASTEQRVEGFQAGCDAYLGKPYAFVEVLARLETLLRPSTPAPGNKPGQMQIGELQLDSTQHLAIRQGHRIPLGPRETLILEKLMLHPDQIVTRLMLLESAWDYDFDPNDNVIDKHIHRLRRKLDDGFDVSLIVTVPGAGYRLEIPEGIHGSTNQVSSMEKDSG